MEADLTLHFYWNNNNWDGGRNEYTLRKWQVTLDGLAMIFKLNFYIDQYRVRNKASEFAHCELFLEKCELKSPIYYKITNQHFSTTK